MKPFGLNIHSMIPLPGCTEQKEPPDVIIHFGHVPDTLPGATLTRACSQECSGRFLLIVDHVARYLVENGKSITIQRSPEATDDEIRLFLMSNVWAVLLLQRGLLPLHGCGIMAGSGAVIFAGPSGNGKSTLAAALMNRGFPLITDELSAVCTNGQPMLLPGFSQILLWADALKKLGIDGSKLVCARPALLKYIVPAQSRMVSDPVLLKRIYILTVNNGTDLAITSLKGMRKIHALIDATYRSHHVEGQDLKNVHFKQCSDAVKHIDVKQVTRGADPFDIESLVSLITEDMQHG